MSDTEQLFIVAGVWAVIAAFVAHFIPNWWGRAALFAILMGVPFWELPYGYYNFRELCNEQAKLHVFQKIPPQNSVCVESLDSLLYANLVKAGFARIEVTSGSDDVRRDTASGLVFPTRRENLISKFCVAFENNTSLPWRVLRHDVLVVGVADGKVAARQSRFVWAGMWWQDQARPVLGRGGRCSEEASRPIVAIRAGTG